MRDVITAVRCEEPTDENYGGWDILISVPFEDGSPGWACIAEVMTNRDKNMILSVLNEVDLVLSSTSHFPIHRDSTDIDSILQRKRQGIDCTEDESVEILRYFDDNPIPAKYDQVVAYFPLEWDQWCGEREQGHR